MDGRLQALTVDDFRLELDRGGELGGRLRMTSRTLGDLAGFPWWDDVEADLCGMVSIPCGTREQPFDDLEQGWQILIWEEDDFVHVAEGDEPCCTEFPRRFRVPVELYRSEWQRLIDECRNSTATRSLEDIARDPERYTRAILWGAVQGMSLEPLTRAVHLESLNLGFNELCALPDLRALGKLRWLDLRINRLESLPDWLGELRSLESLNAAGNRIVRVPPVIARLPCLTTLHLVDNRWRSSPEFLAAGYWREDSPGALERVR